VGHHSEAFIGIDTSKLRNAVAIAEGGCGGEVRFLGEFAATEAAVRKLVAKLTAKYRRLTFCYEAGPTGYWLYRLIKSLGHECIVVAPSLIPKKPGDRVKTNRRDAVSLAKLSRAGELTAVWVPDERHTSGVPNGAPLKRAAKKLLRLGMAPDLLDGRGSSLGDARLVAREVAALVYQQAAIDHRRPHVIGGGTPHKRLQRIAHGAQMGTPKINGDQIGAQARC